MIQDCSRTIDHRYWDSLADKSLAGELLTVAEAKSILAADDLQIPALLSATFRVRSTYFGTAVQLYYLRNAKSGLCPEDCGYCSQSKLSTAPINKYVFQDEKTLLEGARQAKEAKARTFCIVASGRGPTDRELNHVANVVRKIKDEHGLHICVCLGLLTPDQAEVLKEAGVDRVNHNLNTSRRLYDEICSTHTYQDRIDTLKNVRDAGMELCSGCIIGMGETHDDLVELAVTLRDMKVESIPVNFLHPIDGTPLQHTHNISPRDCLRALCMFRLVNPDRELRIAGGRELHLRWLQPQGLYAANSVFVSDYLTTKGQSAEDDYKMIEDLGFQIVKMGCEMEAGSTSQPEAAHAH
ncbi:MAG: biotin synthase BioB [Planctomycetales bacterium]